MHYKINQYLKYYFQSVNKYKIHSPFVFNFITKGVQKKHQSIYKKIANYRQYCKAQNETIPLEDYGAGAKTHQAKKEISSKKLLQKISISKKYSRLLANTVQYFEPKNILELGTAFGIGTATLASNDTHQKIYSLEGNKHLAKLSEQNLKEMNIKDVEIVVGKFDDTLSNVLGKMKQVDLAFIDGNHKKEATLKYFYLLKQYTHNDSVLIFDDIYWSEDMTDAWNTIKMDTDVHLTLDFFQFGMVFLRKEHKEEEHYKIWY